LIGKIHNHSSNKLQTVVTPVPASEMIERFWSGKTIAVAGKE